MILKKNVSPHDFPPQTRRKISKNPFFVFVCPHFSRWVNDGARRFLFIMLEPLNLHTEFLDLALKDS